MRQCPVCDRKTNSLKCPTCGFDASRDYEHAPTLAPTMSIAARRKAWQERQTSLQQEQQWQTERNQTFASLKKAEDARSQAEQQADRFSRELKQIKSDSEAQRRKLEEENQALNARLADAQARADQAYAEAQKTKNIESTKPTYRTFPDLCKGFWSYFFSTDDDSDSVLVTIRKALAWLAMILLVAYLLLDQAHWIFLHTSLAFDDAPCAARPICGLFLCDVSEMHDYQAQGCLLPQQCSVCGYTTGGTHGHIWCDADGDGTKHCHLCNEEVGRHWFYRKKNHGYDITTTGNDTQKTITFADAAEKPSGQITVLDHTGTAISGYTSEWSGDTLTVTFPDSLAVGKYTISAAVNTELVPIVSFYYGAYGIPIPTSTYRELSDFHLQNLLTGQYLISGETSLTTASIRSWKDAPAISDLSELGIRTEDATGEVICTEYYYINSSDQWTYLYVFMQDGDYLAADLNGTVYRTERLSDECYWLLTSES